MIRITLSLLFFLVFGKSSFTQTVFFMESQQLQNYLNPALTGIHGSHNFKLIYQENYWEEFADFSTVGMSFEYSKLFCNSRLDGGISLIHDKEGDGNYTTTLFNINLVYTIPFRIRKSLHNIRMGLSFVDFKHNSINWSNLVFSDQIDSKNGPVLPSSFVPPDQSSALGYNPSIGFVYKTEFMNRIALKLGFSTRYYFDKDQLGLLETGEKERDVSWSFFIYPEFSLVNTRSRYVGLEPSFLLQKEQGLYNYQIGTKIHYDSSYGIGVFLSSGHISGFADNIKSLAWNVFGGLPIGDNQIVLSGSFVQNIGLIKEFGDTFQIGLHYFFRCNGCGRINTSNRDCFNFEVDDIWYDHIWRNPGTGKTNSRRNKKYFQ